MSERKGHIYVITDKTNGKQYVGQTARDIWTRFDEHCRSKVLTPLHAAIQEKGHNNFKLEELETVQLEDLDTREKFWIENLDTYKNGYNATQGGKGTVCGYNQIKIVENDYVIDSATRLGELIQENSLWSSQFIRDKIREAANNNLEFLGYHYEFINSSNVTDEDKVAEWIKTLTLKYCGKSIYCNELNKNFETIAACAKYLVDNELYEGSSKTPIQSLVTSIGKQLHGKVAYVKSSQGNLTFNFLPTTTKSQGTQIVGEKMKIYCPQLDKTFNSQIEAANYFIDNKIWVNIKLKTAKLRISDIIRGAFPDYKGYTFEKK